MSNRRLYTDKEFSAVLKRAAELQRDEGFDDSPGLSLSELEQIAEDAGIDSGFVRRAAFELEAGEFAESNRLFGGPTHIDFERIVDGEMSEETWDRVVGEIRRTFAADGRIREESLEREWIHQDQMGARAHLTVAPTGSETRIRVSYRLTEWLWLHFIMLCVGIAPVAVQYAVLNLGAIAETGIALFILMVFYMIGWITFRVFSRRQERRMRRLIARLERIVADPVAVATSAEVGDRTAAQESGRHEALLPEEDPTFESSTPGRNRERVR